MTKPQKLIDLEAQLDAAERAEREAFGAVAPAAVPPGQRAVARTPADEDIDRWMAAREARDALRLAHRAMIDSLF